MTRVLVLGGTLFLGRHIVAAARARDFAVTVFTRGRSGSVEHSDVECLYGDRGADLGALKGKHWDWVIDTSAYHPRHVQAIAQVLPHVERYVLISSASVYRDFPETGATESTATHEPLWDATVEPGPIVYGQLKRACEEAATHAYAGRVVVIRPGVLVGPFDLTRRFPYWVHRIAAGGEVLAPGSPSRRIQLLDARDLAAWIMGLPASVAEGVFNAAGPADCLTMAGMLSACCDVARSNAQLTWVSDEFLLAKGVMPWSELPLWVPASAGTLLLIDDSKARRLNLRHRSLRDSAADAMRTPMDSRLVLAGGMSKATPLSRDREVALLREWSGARPNATISK